MSATLTHAVEALAAELGWGSVEDPRDAALLEALVDDEVDGLDPAERERLRERVAETAAVLACGACGGLVLARYRPDDGRCRACAGSLAGGAALEGPGGGAATREDGGRLDADLAAEPAWALADALSLGRAIVLDPENEDWDALAERRDAEAEARRRAEEEARREAEEAARREAEEAARKKAQEEAREKAEEEARRKAEEEARKKAEEEAREKAEEEAREKAAAEARRKAEEEIRRRTEEERQRVEEERRRVEEEQRRAEEEAQRAAEEAEQRRKAEQTRPALGGLYGPGAGQLVRVEDEPEEVAVGGGQSRVYLKDGVARLHVAPGVTERVNNKKVTQTTELRVGDIISLGESAFVVDETGELEGVSAPEVHFARADDKPGGPWPYWNQRVRIGAALGSEVRLVDDAVADEHAIVETRFGRVVLEDHSSADDGVWIKGKRMRWLMLRPDMTFRLGREGPELGVRRGQAEIKAKKKAARMKPTRHNRVVLDVLGPGDELIKKVFLFTRREIRFGRGSVSDDRKLNELILNPSDVEGGTISLKQGALTLTRGGVEVQRWRDGEADMLLDDEPIERGESVELKRRFTLHVGEGMLFEGRVYRSPTDVELEDGPPRLGMLGGHPYECVRLDRVYTTQVYVYLVRMLRIGADPNAPLPLDQAGVRPHHAQVQLRQGKYQLVAPYGDVTVEVGDDEVELEPGVPATLQVGARIRLGEATLVFRVASEDDFDV